MEFCRLSGKSHEYPALIGILTFTRILIAVALIYPPPYVYEANSLEPETGTLVSGGNSMSFEFNTANIPGGSPASWGPQCEAFLIGPSGGSAFWWRQYPIASPKGYVLSLDFMLLDSAMTDGTGVTFAILKAQGNIYTAPRNLRAYLSRFGGDYRFVFVIDEDEEQVAWFYPRAGGITRGIVYQHRMEYDIVKQRIAWTVDEVLVNETAMIAGNPQNVGSIILGSSGSSNGRNTIFLLDRIVWKEAG